eukprot:16439369-Heterocapsa_arctica.AAC.2
MELWMRTGADGIENLNCISAIKKTKERFNTKDEEGRLPMSKTPLLHHRTIQKVSLSLKR